MVATVVTGTELGVEAQAVVVAGTTMLAEVAVAEVIRTETITGTPTGNPLELRSKAAPADPSQPLIIDGIDYWYCTKHKKWGKYPTQRCHKDQDSGNDNGGSTSGNSGNRNGRAVRALAAIAQHGHE